MVEEMKCTCLRVRSSTNEWMDCIFLVEEKDKEMAVGKLNQAWDDLWEEGEVRCYGDFLGARLTEAGIRFDAEYIKQFHQKIDEYLSDGWKENEKEPDTYGAPFERTLLTRIAEYRRNYFMWVEDFSLPSTNNLSERGLRGVKSHMKISGQFESEATADNHALIRTYIETCRRNGINEIDALQRLCSGNPYSVEEIFSLSLP